jgi:hypothetical protein
MTQAVPRLAPPGAGLPAIERFIGSTLFALRRWTGTRAAFNAQFERERRAIADLLAARDEPTLRRSVLIPRLRGLEDSSRFWSAYMTLDHLRIVNRSIIGVIAELALGHVPPGQASTATVKPAADVGPEVVAPYEAACDALLREIAAHPILNTSVRYAHPWFGPLDAAGWHALAAMHMGIHRAQIERILR